VKFHFTPHAVRIGVLACLLRARTDV